jgi:trimeric autotransporter adhesin
MKQKCTFLFFLLAAAIFYAPSLQAQLINTFAGTGAAGFTGDGGLATLAKLNSCTGVAYDGAGNIYIADRGNNVVRKVNTYGYISTFAGNDTAGYSGDGGNPTLAELNQPYGVATDVAGNVYIADYGNNAVRVVSPSGYISTFAGGNLAGYSGDGAKAKSAQLSGPEAVAVDQSGNVYIADANNNVVRIMYAVDSLISTFAGNGYPGYSGDGSAAASAQLNAPSSLAIDVYGDVYIADYLNNAIRKVDTSGNISTFAGTGLGGYYGDGGLAVAAGLHFPAGVAVYGFGTVYIADEGNNVVRMVDTSGNISTFAGTATNGYRGDGGNANAAELSAPRGVAVDALSRLFIADYGNNVVRVVYINTPAGVNTVANAAGELQVYPNPSNGAFTIVLPGTGTNDATVTVMDMLGRCVETRNIDGASQRSGLDFDVPSGSYIVKVSQGGNNYRAQVVVIK